MSRSDSKASLDSFDSSTPKALFEKSSTSTSLLYTSTPGNHWIIDYIHSSSLTDTLKNMFPHIQIKLERKELEIRNVEDMAAVRQQMEKTLVSIRRIQLEDQGLSLGEYNDSFKEDEEVSSLMKAFLNFGYEDGKVSLYYQGNKLKKEAALKRAWQIEGFRKETLLMECREFPSFMSCDPEQVEILLQVLMREYGANLRELSSRHQLKLSQISAFEKTSLAFTVMGFKKNFMALYDSCVELLHQTKAALKEFRPDTEEKRGKFKQLLKKESSELRTRDVCLMEFKDHVVVLGDDTIPSSILLFINSNRYSLHDKFKDHADFLAENAEKVRKILKRRVEYLNFDFDQLEIETDQANYEECVKMLKDFIFNEKEYPQIYYFRTKINKNTFLNHLQGEVSFRTEGHNQQAITFYSTKPNLNRLEEKLKEIDDNITAQTKRILVPSTVNDSSLSPCLTVTKRTHMIDNPHLITSFTQQNLQVSISHRIEEEEMDCIIGCFNIKEQDFMDQYIHPLLDVNQMKSVKSVKNVKSAKKNAVSLQRMSVEWCSNLILHRFEYLNEDKVFKDLDVVFGQIKDVIGSMTLVVPERFQYWPAYVEDFYTNLIDQRNIFTKLHKISIVCTKKAKSKIIELFKDKINTSPNPNLLLLNKDSLIKHRCLHFHILASPILITHILPPLLKQMIYQHLCAKSQNIVFSVPSNLNLTTLEYIANLESQTVTNTSTKKTFQMIAFVKCQMLKKLLKANVKNKKRNFPYFVYYTNEKGELVGDLFEMGSEKKELRLLNGDYTPSGKSYEYHVELIPQVKARIAEGYAKEVDNLAKTEISLNQTPTPADN